MQFSEFATRDLPARSQLEAWQAWYGQVFDTSPLHQGDDGFCAHARAWILPGLTLNQVTAPGLSVVRTNTLIRREPVDHWAITLSKRHVTWLNSGTASMAAPAGEPFVLSLGRTMENRREADDRIQLYLSRDSFHGIAAVLDACCMTALEPSGAKLLADYMRLLLGNLPTLGDKEALGLVDATRAMIVACLAPSVHRIADAQPIINVTLMQRVRHAVRRHLHSPALAPDLICREAATSRSQLYRLLESEGGVSRYVQKLRLAEAFELLRSTSQDSSVGRIAEMLCFADSSSFARAFRREFGVSPSDVRDAARAGLPPVPDLAGANESATPSFAACLRGTFLPASVALGVGA